MIIRAVQLRYSRTTTGRSQLAAGKTHRPARNPLPYQPSRNQGIEESGAGGQYFRELIRRLGRDQIQRIQNDHN
ncbi:MAG: hypothetical protein QGE95_15255 [Arenicellales bacterium]|nr:hypothetical protein [Arenicellales bacterium]